MYLDEEITLVGILPDKDLTDTISEIDLKRVVYEALGIGPMYQPLITDLKEKNYVDASGEIEMQDVVKCLHSNSFLTTCPNVSNIINDNLFLL